MKIDTAEVKKLKETNKEWMGLCNRLLKKYCDGITKIEMLEQECAAYRTQLNELQAAQK